MGITNQEIDKLQVNPEIKRQLKFLKQSPVIYNNASLLPTEVTWIVPLETMEKTIAGIVRDYLGKSEVNAVTISPRSDARSWPYVTAWISARSRHLVDDSQQNADLLIQPKIKRFSKELVDFCDQYAPDHNDRGQPIKRQKRVHIVSAQRESNVVGIDISLEFVIQRLFDVKNRGFSDAFGTDSPIRSCDVRCSAIFSNKRNDASSRLTAIRITKKYTDVSSGNTRYVRAFNQDKT